MINLLFKYSEWLLNKCSLFDFLFRHKIVAKYSDKLIVNVYN